MAKLLELQDISKNYEDDPVLSGVSLAIDKGTATAIIGDSGGGKTTLLSIMGLLQQPTAGKVLLEGVDTGGLKQHEHAKLRGKYFGFVFQRARLLNSLTALENVLAPAWFNKTGEDLESRARELLKHLEMGHRLNHKPQELSLGQLRRVSLARALLLNPPILLADEPTNDLDPDLAQSVAECLLQARNAGTAVVIITHDHSLAVRADKVLRLQQGRIHSVEQDVCSA